MNFRPGIPVLFSLVAVVLFFAAGCGLLRDVWNDATSSDEAATATPVARWTATPAPKTSKTPVRRPTPIPTATPTTPVDMAQAYLEDISDKWSETDSVHFVLDIDGKTYLDAGEQLEFRGAEGDLVRPDSSSVKATIYGGIIEFDISLIFIGDEAYMTNFVTGRWEEAPANLDFNPALLFSETKGIGAVLQEIRDPEVVGYERIDDRTTRRISGTVAESQIDDVVGGMLEGDEIRVDVWMDVGSDRLVKVVLAETDGVEKDRRTWELTFSRHNVPVSVERPDV